MDQALTTLLAVDDGMRWLSVYDIDTTAEWHTLHIDISWMLVVPLAIAATVVFCMWCGWMTHRCPPCDPTDRCEDCQARFDEANK